MNVAITSVNESFNGTILLLATYFANYKFLISKF
jgi:hypothetical protein